MSTCPRARTSSARSGSRPASSATSTRWPRCPHESAAAATARWPSTTSSPATTSKRWTSHERITRCVEIKADLVAADEREGGRRALLNYGHTLAHALEIAAEHRVTHGEAVGIGLVYAAELAAELGRIDRDRVAAHREVVAGYGLATTIPDGLVADDLVTLMGRDKKAARRADVRPRRAARRRGRRRRRRGAGARRPGAGHGLSRRRQRGSCRPCGTKPRTHADLDRGSGGVPFPR